ncbi:IclR family transcriptional regulator [Halobellus ordinarius]|uniref:IclR family transcriptional regulator n=1 Tax=Halobellus ordinarius TaxID=3075120 RepID=UPI00288056D1|nr:IclR family transcriptional regulator [Halobellus sp. ZY16]
MTHNTGKRTIQSIERGCELLDYLRRNGPATIAEMESHSELSAGSIHTYLSTFKDYGFVEQEESRYRLGALFIPFGVRVRNQSSLYPAAKTIIHQLAQSTGGCVHLMTEYEDRLLILDEVYGEDAVDKDFHFKKRGRLQPHLHCTAGGKSILAHVSEPRVHEILDSHGLPARTSHTVTDRDRLFDELERVRERGYALNDQEHMPGIRAVGAPVRHDDSGDVIGTVSVSVSAASWTGDLFREELPTVVKKAANEIEIRIHTEELSS